MRKQSRRFYNWVSLVTIVGAGLVSVWWLFDLPINLFSNTDLPTMKLSTSLSFLAIGTLLLVRDNKFLTFVCLTVVFLLGITSAFEHLMPGSGLIDVVMLGYGELMSPATATCFLGLALGWLFSGLQNRNFRVASQFLYHAITFIAFFGMIGFIYGIDNESKLRFIASMSIPTSLLFFLLSIAASYQNPTLGFTGLLTGHRRGNIVSRYMFTIMVSVCLLSGLLVVSLLRQDIIGGETGLSLLALIMLLACLLGITFLSLTLNKADDKRALAQAELETVNRGLEEEVKKRTKEQMKAYELLTLTNRAASIGSWYLDLSTSQIKWSETTRQIHEVPKGYNPSLEDGIRFYKDGADREMISQLVTEAIERQNPWDVELQILTYDQREKWVRSIGSPVIENGVCVGLSGTFQDIDSRKKAELELSEEREFLQTVIDQVPMGIVVKNTDLKPILSNKSYHLLLGSLKLGGHQEANVYFSETEKRTAGVLRDGEQVPPEEIHVPAKQGDGRWLWQSLAPIRNLDDDVTGIMEVTLDVTLRKETESQLAKLATLESKSKEMEQFAYIASHDLKEPLLTIKNYVSLLLAEIHTASEEEIKKFSKTIYNGVGRMEVLIDGLLDYARLSNPDSLQPVDVDFLIRETVEALEATINKTNARVEISNELHTVVGYISKLRILLQNLISNAIKFRKPGTSPVIEISGSENEKEWLLCVKDNGIGIAQEYQEGIFEMFRRLHARAEYEGTGIGLAQCYKIAELHTGRIWVESELNSGSLFCFAIPKNITNEKA